jgi:hypothetical protein
MAGIIANEVFDAALNYAKNNTNKVQIVTAASAVLINKTGVTSAAFGSAGDNAGSSGGGRKIQALTGSTFQGLAVSTPGSASKVRLLKSSTVVAVTSIASAPKALGASDQANIGSFSIILKDPS